MAHTLRNLRVLPNTLIALLIPFGVAVAWKNFAPLLQGVPGYLSLLAVALAARFLGLVPAIAAALGFAAMLWFQLLPETFPGRPLPFLILRLLLYVLAAAVIISISRRRESELRETEEMYRALVEMAPDGIGVSDDEGHILFGNDALARLLGAKDPSELVGKKTTDFTHPDFRGLARSRFGDLQANRDAPPVEVKWVTLDGRIIDVETAAVPVNRNGRLQFQGFVRDLTERKTTAAKLEETAHSVRQLSARLLQLQDEERRRIARQLHDTTAQNLAALRLNLSRISRSAVASDSATRKAIDESIELTEQSVAEIRTLSYLLHPPMIEEVGLLPTLQWYAQGFEERSGIKVHLKLPPELDRLPLELATTLFRIVQEALTNVQRHSGSGVATIRLEKRQQALHLEIEDEGRGMPESLRHDETFVAAGVGIAGIRERVREYRGQMHIQSRDTGTVISVTLPMPEK